MMVEQQWSWGSWSVGSDMGNKQTIFTAQQLDAYQVCVILPPSGDASGQTTVNRVKHTEEASGLTGLI